MRLLAILSAVLFSSACGITGHSDAQPSANVEANAPAAPPAVVEPPAPASLLASLQSQLQHVNPSIRLVEIYDIQHVSITDSTWYLLIALGHGIHRGWKDPSQVGEIFGVFGIDSALSHATRVLDMFPTPRMGDYDLFFDHTQQADSIVILGQGATYRDSPMRRAYLRWSH